MRVIYEVGVDLGGNTGMTGPYYSGMISDSFANRHLALIRHLAWLAPLEMKNITLVTLHSVGT